jgi:hypothetical protein
MTSGKKLVITGGTDWRPPRRPGSRAQPRRMRSQYVVFGVLGTVALACCGYAAFGESRQCVDSTNTVVDDSQCRNGHTGTRWYYGGTSRGFGTKATGGSYTRGGFGGHFSGGS